MENLNKTGRTNDVSSRKEEPELLRLINKLLKAAELFEENNNEFKHVISGFDRVADTLSPSDFPKNNEKLTNQGIDGCSPSRVGALGSLEDVIDRIYSNIDIMRGIISSGNETAFFLQTKI